MVRRALTPQTLTQCIAEKCKREQELAVGAVVELMRRNPKDSLQAYTDRVQRSLENIALLDCQVKQCQQQAVLDLKARLAKFARKTDAEAKRACERARALIRRPDGIGSAAAAKEYVAVMQAFARLAARM